MREEERGRDIEKGKGREREIFPSGLKCCFEDQMVAILLHIDKLYKPNDIA